MKIQRKAYLKNRPKPINDKTQKKMKRRTKKQTNRASRLNRQKVLIFLKVVAHVTHQFLVSFYPFTET